MKRLARWLAIVAFGLVVVAAAVVYRWTLTPYGRLDPEVAIMLHVVPALPSDETVPMAVERDALRRLMRLSPSGSVPVAHVEDRDVPGPAGPMRLRVYRPSDANELPLVLYFHGGGFCLGDLDTHDRICRLLASKADAIVVAVNYRLAPEYPYPAAVEDTYAALDWAAGHAQEIRGDTHRIAVAGDSSGGNLAAVVALKARDERGPALVFQLLIYPATDLSSLDTGSHRDLKAGLWLTRPIMELNRRRYLPAPADRRQPYASPLLAGDLQGLPPALVITAQFDPLRDEGEAYGRALAAAGVRSQVRRYDGVVHGFFGQSLLRAGRRAADDAAAALREAFRR
jgi:acetyl esterase